MKTTQITVKEVDETAFKELKAEAVRDKMPIGAALSLAIETWLATKRKPKLSLTDWKTFKGGHGTERLSEQVDEILYG